jgi:hypothetical protein
MPALPAAQAAASFLGGRAFTGTLAFATGLLLGCHFVWQPFEFSPRLGDQHVTQNQDCFSVSSGRSDGVECEQLDPQFFSAI